MEAFAVQEKQMEVCEVCGAFLIVGDAQSRVDDHLMGKQHMGYAKIKSVIAELKVGWNLFIWNPPTFNVVFRNSQTTDQPDSLLKTLYNRPYLKLCPYFSRRIANTLRLGELFLNKLLYFFPFRSISWCSGLKVYLTWISFQEKLTKASEREREERKATRSVVKMLSTVLVSE